MFLFAPTAVLLWVPTGAMGLAFLSSLLISGAFWPNGFDAPDASWRPVLMAARAICAAGLLLVVFRPIFLRRYVPAE